VSLTTTNDCDIRQDCNVTYIPSQVKARELQVQKHKTEHKAWSPVLVGW